MTINTHTHPQPKDSAPVLHIQTLKDLSPKYDDKIRGGRASMCTHEQSGCN